MKTSGSGNPGTGTHPVSSRRLQAGRRRAGGRAGGQDTARSGTGAPDPRACLPSSGMLPCDTVPSTAVVNSGCEGPRYGNVGSVAGDQYPARTAYAAHPPLRRLQCCRLRRLRRHLLFLRRSFRIGCCKHPPGRIPQYGGFDPPGHASGATDPAGAAAAGRRTDHSAAGSRIGCLFHASAVRSVKRRCVRISGVLKGIPRCVNMPELENVHAGRCQTYPNPSENAGQARFQAPMCQHVQGTGIACDRLRHNKRRRPVPSTARNRLQVDANVGRRGRGGVGRAVRRTASAT